MRGRGGRGGGSNDPSLPFHHACRSVEGGGNRVRSESRPLIETRLSLASSDSCGECFSNCCKSSLRSAARFAASIVRILLRNKAYTTQSVWSAWARPRLGKAEWSTCLGGGRTFAARLVDSDSNRAIECSISCQLSRDVCEARERAATYSFAFVEDPIRIGGDPHFV